MLISEEQKLDAWRWLCREAMAGNTNAVTVLVDWSSGPDEDEDLIDQLAVTFQWWLDHDADRPAGVVGAGVVPPRLPNVKQMLEWTDTLRDAAASVPGTSLGNDLAGIANCLSLLTEHSGRQRGQLRLVTPDDTVNPPGWPSRPVLESWIATLAAFSISGHPRHADGN